MRTGIDRDIIRTAGKKYEVGDHLTDIELTQLSMTYENVVHALSGLQNSDYRLVVTDARRHADNLQGFIRARREKE